MTILIPSYEPDVRLLNLILQLQTFQLGPIVIVDDGSGQEFRGIFETAEAYGCTLLTHPENLGKGRALKTGFQYIKEFGPQGGVVCADSDGQHLPHDIRRIFDVLLEQTTQALYSEAAASAARFLHAVVLVIPSHERSSLSRRGPKYMIHRLVCVVFPIRCWTGYARSRGIVLSMR
ncbi:glycosyltransferase [Paenibacillus sp. FSL K6-2862]|uniref:glycosyltransferase n=1 Tax=Paenibacillus sp. FSL K6-2862 TaxID=2921484 RepID=UPI0030F85496